MDRHRYYRRDGTPYPDGIAGLLQWGTDFEDEKLRQVALSKTLYGEEVSTVWLGMDHAWDGPPSIFETMVFFKVHRRRESRDVQLRYSTLQQAQAGHRRMCAQCLVPPFLRRFFFEAWR